MQMSLMPNRTCAAFFAAVVSCVWVSAAPVYADEGHPIPADQREKMYEQFDKTIERATAQIAADPTNIDAYSQRGDAYFFRGKFAEAVADYERMVELNPKLESSHWRRGISYFYTEQYKQAARQFEIYHTFDDVDRENGIWRFFSQAKAYGIDKAREGLLKYKKDDRQPFPAVYRLFSGATTPAEVLEEIEAADVEDGEREKRRFYAHLYVGLNDAISGKKKDRERAVHNLRKSITNKWGPAAGYGPNYMWHVGRLQYELLTNSSKR